MALFCFDIGGSTIKAALATSPTELTMLERVPTPLQDFEAFVGAIATLIGAAAAEAGAPVSISITGVIDPQTGLTTVANIPCVNGRHLAAELSQRLGRKVSVANDADCFVLAEAIAGAGRGYNVVFGAILGTGVGGGLVIGGRLLEGGGGLTGEWGHGTIVATETEAFPGHVPHFLCGCGLKGCVDTVGGARGLERLHQFAHGDALPSTEIITRWLAGDQDAMQTVELFVELISKPLALVVNVVGAEIIPVGGGLGNCLPLIEKIDVAVRGGILRHLERPLVVPAQLTVDAGLIGAATRGFLDAGA